MTFIKNFKMAEDNPHPRSRVFLACVPRSVSTSLTKCLSMVDDDHEVWFEPYISCMHASIEYKLRMGKELPPDYEGNEIEYEKAAIFVENQGADIDVNDLSGLPASTSGSRMSSYSEVKKCLDTSSSRLVIVKDFGSAVDGFYQYLPSIESGYKYIFLIRDPLLCAMSYRRSVVAFNKKHAGLVDESTLDVSEDKFYPGAGEAFRRLHAFWCYVRANIDPNPLIVETDDLLAHPAECVRKICEVSGLEYSDALLKWHPAASSDDWMKIAKTSMGEIMSNGFLCDFHASAMKSTGFNPLSKSKPNEAEITPDVLRIEKKAKKFYMEMYKHRFKPDG